MLHQTKQKNVIPENLRNEMYTLRNVVVSGWRELLRGRSGNVFFGFYRTLTVGKSQESVLYDSSCQISAIFKISTRYFFMKCTANCVFKRRHRQYFVC